MTKRLVTGVGLVVLAFGFVLVVGRPHAAAVTRTAAIEAAAAYGPAHGYRVGIAVLDTASGAIYGGGASTGTFASESVVKTMIATRLLVQGRMSGTTAKRAYKMITQSDDAIASAFYPSVGGDGLISWIKQRYEVWDLGTRPSRPGWWGNTHITPRGLVKFYSKVKRDRKVGPWLLNAMHHATQYGSDGMYQFFGLPSATANAAIKQGWGCDYDDWERSADFNTTGFVNGDRYAVAILARGPIKYYGKPIRSMLTQTARLLLPGGHFPDPPPTVRSLTVSKGRVAGGQRVGVSGTSFTHVQAVVFGGRTGTAVRVFSSRYLRVTTPAHAAGIVPVRIVTDHGTSALGTVRFTYIAPAAITSVSPASGSTLGGTAVVLTGVRFSGATQVLFGGQPGTAVHVTSDTSLTVVTPSGTAGIVDVRVVTPYGTSPVTDTAQFTYVDEPTSTH
jgi:hypothetical protein